MSSTELPSRYEPKSISKKISTTSSGDSSPNRIRINTKKNNTIAKACVMRLLKTEPEIEDEGKYLKTSDIKPLKNPEKQIKIVFKDLISSDWQKQFDACNTLRALAIHHKETFIGDVFLMQNFIQNLIKQVESLRSTVSKNALLGFKDILASLKKRMDNDLDYLLPAVMKKATDTNTFLSKAATDLLVSA